MTLITTVTDTVGSAVADAETKVAAYVRKGADVAREQLDNARGQIDVARDQLPKLTATVTDAARDFMQTVKDAAPTVQLSKPGPTPAAKPVAPTAKATKSTKATKANKSA